MESRQREKCKTLARHHGGPRSRYRTDTFGLVDRNRQIRVRFCVIRFTGADRTDVPKLRFYPERGYSNHPLPSGSVGDCRRRYRVNTFFVRRFVSSRLRLSVKVTLPPESTIHRGTDAPSVVLFMPRDADDLRLLRYNICAVKRT